jgi:hypothetical protein
LRASSHSQQHIRGNTHRSTSSSIIEVPEIFVLISLGLNVPRAAILNLALIPKQRRNWVYERGTLRIDTAVGGIHRGAAGHVLTYIAVNRRPRWDGRAIRRRDLKSVDRSYFIVPGEDTNCGNISRIAVDRDRLRRVREPCPTAFWAIPLARPLV